MEEAKLKTGPVNIVSSFWLEWPNGTRKRIEPGMHDLPNDPKEDIGRYVLAHSRNPPKPEFRVGTQEYAAEQARKNAQEAILDAAIARETERKMREHGKRR